MKKPLRVLMIEDSLSDSELILYELKKAGIETASKVVSCKPDFVEALLEFLPDIILSDFSMPAFDGLSALRIAKEKCPEVPFVFVSGTIGEERAIEALKCGATDYILKDHLSGLVPKCKRALKEAKQRLDQQNAEKQLRKSQRQLAEAQEVARLGNWEHDLSSDIVTWSDGIYALLGFDKALIIPSKDNFTRVIHPEDILTVKKTISEVYSTYRDFAYYCRIIKENKKEVRYLYVKGKFKNEGEGRGKVFGILQDITELKETEKQLKESNNELKTFIYKAHHDLRGPIASAIGLCNLALNEASPKDHPANYLQLIDNCLKKLDNSIHQLTEAMTIKDKRLAIAPIKFEAIITDVLNSMKYMNGFQRITFRLSGLETELAGDEKIIRSIFHNLIENAIKYQNQLREDPVVSINIRPMATGATIEVIDNGIGIPENMLEKIFEMFTRGHEESKGTGLGLYIVKNSIERIKGSIKVESRVGEGSKFIISLPNIYTGTVEGDKAENRMSAI